MKRIGYLFEKVVDIENIKLAIENAVGHRKRKGKNVIKIRDNSDYYAEEIRNSILADFEFHAPVECEIQDYPKIRKLRKPKFYPDQIIMWAFKQVVEPILNRGQYLYSFSGVRGRGNLTGKKYIERVERKRGNSRTYIKQDDLRQFYNNIDNAKMKSCFRRVIKDKLVLHWLDKIIDIGGKGLPIGFPTSPLFGNFYLQEFDHAVKEKYKIKYYARFADDVFIADGNKRKIKRFFEGIKTVLNKYGVWFKNLRPIYKLYSQSIDFVGYVFYRGYTHLRDRTFYCLTRIVRNIQRLGGTLKRYMRYLVFLGIAKYTSFKKYYVERIKPIISKGKARKSISNIMKARKAVYGI